MKNDSERETLLAISKEEMNHAAVFEKYTGCMLRPAAFGCFAIHLPSVLIAVAIIACFNFYISIAKSKPFRRNFFVMISISMGVAAIFFAVGLVVKNILGIDL